MTFTTEIHPGVCERPSNASSGGLGLSAAAQATAP